MKKSLSFAINNLGSEYKRYGNSGRIGYNCANKKRKVNGKKQKRFNDLSELLKNEPKL